MDAKSGGSRKPVLHEDVDSPTGRAVLGCHGRLNRVIGFWGWVKGRAVQSTGGPISTVYTSYDVFLRSDLPLGVAMVAPALKFLMALTF